MVDPPDTNAEAPYRIGMVISNKFVLLRFIAGGGMSMVFEAKDEIIQRHVAIKLLRPEHTRNADIIRRFRREAQLTASIQHPHVVGVLEMGQRRDSSFYMVQELLKGENLRVHLSRRGVFPADEAIELLLPIMAALNAAHSQGIVHRDLKPENIVLASAPSGEILPKLIDFGIAKGRAPEGGEKLTAMGAQLGTPEYMSPEQINGVQPLDARTDVWAMGVVLYELLSAVTPHSHPNDPPATVLAKVLSRPATPLRSVARSVPDALAAIIHSAIEPDLGRRHPSMQAFRDALMSFMNRRSAVLMAPSVSDSPDALPASQDTVRMEIDQDWLNPEDLIVLEEGPASLQAVPASKPAQVIPGSRPQTEAAWIQDAHAAPATQADRDAEAAERSLGVNRLQEAIDFAERALATQPSRSAAGRMLLLQAIAHRWLGDYEASERSAREAAARLERGSGAWYAALGHAAVASGHLGRSKPLLAIVEELKKVDITEEKVHFHVTVLARTSIFLIRTGLPNMAQTLMDEADRLIGPDGDTPTHVRAWLDVSRAELVLHRGYLVAYLRHTEAAVEGFTAAGDLRNACLQRASIGNAYMHLGAYRRAVTVLEEALDVAEPMGLDFAALVKVNLGYTLAQLGLIDKGIVIESAAFRQCIQQKNRRVAGCSLIYLATMHDMRGDVTKAINVAQDAVRHLEGDTTLYPFALATLAQLLLTRREPDLALQHARRGFELLEELGGVEEGESLIRTAYALALGAAGQEAAGRTQLAEARRLLLERAARISDASWRQSFLEGVLDNARVLHLAAQWVDANEPPPDTVVTPGGP